MFNAITTQNKYNGNWITKENLEIQFYVLFFSCWYSFLLLLLLFGFEDISSQEGGDDGNHLATHNPHINEEE